MRRLIAVVLLLGSCSPAAAAPCAEPWPRWKQQDAASARRVGQAPWAGLLRRNFRPWQDGVNRFAYGAVTPADREAPEADLARLA